MISSTITQFLHEKKIDCRYQRCLSIGGIFGHNWTISKKEGKIELHTIELYYRSNGMFGKFQYEVGDIHIIWVVGRVIPGQSRHQVINLHDSECFNKLEEIINEYGYGRSQRRDPIAFSGNVKS